jgi:hypothetical protein
LEIYYQFKENEVRIMKKTTKTETTSFSMEEMNQILGAWGKAMRRKYLSPPKEEYGLQAAPPEGRESGEHFYAHRGLTISRNTGPNGTTFRFTGHSEQWAGRLLHAHWSWPGQEKKEQLSCFILLPEEPFDGKYFAEISLPVRIAHLPDWASIDMEAVSPTEFAREWKKAAVKPGLEQMASWVSRQSEAVQKKWQSVLSKLNK